MSPSDGDCPPLHILRTWRCREHITLRDVVQRAETQGLFHWVLSSSTLNFHTSIEMAHPLLSVTRLHSNNSHGTPCCCPLFTRYVRFHQYVLSSFAYAA